MKPVPHKTCDAVAAWVRMGDSLLGELRILEQGGATFAHWEARRILDLIEAMETRVEDMEIVDG